jgi:predicted DNA binding protein
MMRRLILEVSVSELVRFSGDKSIEEIKSLEVLNFIKQDLKEFVIVCNIEFRSRRTRLDDVFNEPESEVQVLDHRGKKYTILFKSKARSDNQTLDFWSAGGYLLPPLEIRNDMVRMTFVGSAKQVRSLPIILRRAGIHYKVIQLADANFSRISPLSRLTEKQRKVLTTAYNLGYYDVPRKISSQQLARNLKIGSSDFIKHRRKAEKRLLAAVLSAS